MYTYKLGGMLITDELYHDDLEAMTFGRKDQNELMHYGIKGQSWGKRRFQNEDGSLTMAGRNRYDVGLPLIGTTATNMAKNLTYKTWNGSSNGYGGASGGGTSTAQPGKKFIPVVPKPQTKSDTRTVPKSITDRANSGKKAADNIFGKISNWAGGAANTVGNWAGNAANDIGRTATNAYNDASKAVTGAANAAGNWATNAYNDASKAVTGAANDAGNYVKNAAQDVSDWFTGDKAGREAQRYDNVVQNFERNGDRNINEGIDTISKAINIKYKYPNVSEANFDKGIKQRNLGYDQHEIASQYGQKADEAQARYDAAPRQMLNAVGNWIGDAANDVGKTVSGAANAASNAIGNAARDVGDWAGQAANDAKNWVGDRAQDVGNAVSSAAKDVGNAVNGAAKDVADWGAGAVESGKNFFNNLFGGGNKEPEQPTLSDSNERITEQRIPEQLITENRIEEQRIPEQLITENRIEEQEYHDTLNSISDTLRTAKTATERENALRDLISTMDNNGAFRVRSGFKNDTPMSFWAERAKNNLDRIDGLQENLDKGYYTGEEAERAKREIAEAKIDNELMIGNFYHNTNASGRWGPDGLVGNYENTPDNVSQQEWDRYVAKNYGHYPNRGRRTISHSILDEKPSGVTDSFWSDYISIGGTREKYDKVLNDLANRR